MAKETSVNASGAVEFATTDLEVLVMALEEMSDTWNARAADDKQYTGEQRNEWEDGARRAVSLAALLCTELEERPISETNEPVIVDSAWLLAFIEAKAAALVDTVRRKNADYSGAAPDPFGNFRNVEDLGIATVEQGFLTRMTDKLARAASLTKPGKTAQVKDESVEDTLFDLAAYSFLLAAYRASVRLRSEGRTLP